jgi:hypothetical protein
MSDDVKLSLKKAGVVLATMAAMTGIVAWASGPLNRLNATEQKVLHHEVEIKDLRGRSEEQMKTLIRIEERVINIQEKIR